ncbi:FKBP-type peptidyl-prolyl cis-trans isomerase [Algoriphagus halophytocola]|uniref:Peptidyl-prolyl cis-trans isomerase n=1 Tax=Algoriphagus halophytocola TaxID=2991499 RepID=A0ABY6MCP1_9BACT|nr:MULTISPECIES: FKBP-type peptidyl-prolyl cis-trans isomerase [unclassified Algoriphagus]UZD21473.1 FKBP-type peptidyl-prolyl cis-trans isomerase [Algoriphagus sp. TR-M5]WBL42685.1 FKBP-type peptidyl-prolyl cis-trans isomerase [Algoriphagus sp. TR-M9]
MKIRVFTILSLLAGSMAMISCIDDEATDEVILANDKASIEEYLANNSIVNVKEVHDENTGLRVIWQEVSESGVGVEAGDTLSVNYVGRLLTNQVFDTSLEDVAVDAGIYSSSRDYEPLVFPIGYNFLISGFEYGAGQMEVGDKATVFIPSLFAYGRQGSGSIPANSPIMFELELISVTPGPVE